MTADTCYLGFDLGTTNLKAAAVSIDGTVRAVASEGMDYDTDGIKTEFDVENFYVKFCLLVKKLIRELPARAAIEAACISSASGNAVLLDDKNRPMIPAKSWLDTSENGETAAVLGNLDPDEIYRRVGWPYHGSFPLAQLCMIKVKRPGLIEQAAKIAMTSEYINLRLCGAFAMDYSTATTFYLSDQRTKRWHVPYLDALGVPESKLPALLPVGTMIGEVGRAASAETGLPAGAKVYLGAFDHPSAAYGAGVTREGLLLLSCGTSWVGFAPVKGRDRVLAAGLLCDPFLENDGLWGGYFSLPKAGQRVDAFIETFISNGPDRYDMFNELAAQSAPGAGGLTIDVYGDIPRSLYDRKKSDVARACMEGVARLMDQKIKQLGADGINVGEAVMCGGPSLSPVWPAIVSETIGKPVRALLYGAHAGAAGAAKIAIATGRKAS